MWDLRSLSSPLHGLRAHSLAHAPATPLQFFNLSWAPFSSNLLLATDYSRRAYIWDVSRIGSELEEQFHSGGGGEHGDAAADDWDAADSAPAELLFVHGGACDRLSDAAWNPNEHEEWMVASVADDNVLQLWQGQQATSSSRRAHGTAHTAEANELQLLADAGVLRCAATRSHAFLCSG